MKPLAGLFLFVQINLIHNQTVSVILIKYFAKYLQVINKVVSLLNY